MVLNSMRLWKPRCGNQGAGDEIADKTRFNILGDNGYYTFTPDVSADGRPLVTFYALNSSIQAQKSDEATQITWLSKKLSKTRPCGKFHSFIIPFMPGRRPRSRSRFSRRNRKHAGCRRCAHDPCRSRSFLCRMKPQKGIIHFISGGVGAAL